MKVGQFAKQRIADIWLPSIKEGDKIIFRHNEAVLYNSSYCELDRVSLIH